MKKYGRNTILETAMAVIVALMVLRILGIVWKLSMGLLVPLAVLALALVPLAFLWFMWRGK